jgi:hypothetical protein
VKDIPSEQLHLRPKEGQIIGKKKCLKPTTTNNNNVNQNCRQRPPKTTHLLVELHAGVSPQVWGPRAPILQVLEKSQPNHFIYA